MLSPDPYPLTYASYPLTYESSSDSRANIGFYGFPFCICYAVKSRRLRREEREGLTEAPDGAREGANQGGAAAPPRWIGHAV